MVWAGQYAPRYYVLRSSNIDYPPKSYRWLADARRSARIAPFSLILIFQGAYLQILKMLLNF
jgi:hypothetical protein